MTIYYPPLAEVSMDATGALLCDANGSRKKLLIQARAANTALVRIFLLETGSAVVGSASYIELAAGGVYEPSEAPSNAIWLKSASGTQAVAWTEA